MLVELKDIGIVGVGEVMILFICIFYKLLGIDEKVFMCVINVIFKLGIEFVNWCEFDYVYIYFFGVIGCECWVGEFYYFWMCVQQEGLGLVFGDYCFELKVVQ